MAGCHQVLGTFLAVLVIAVAHEECDVKTSEPRVELISPGYPIEYPPQLNCRYTILPANEAVCQVSLLVKDFDVEDSARCFKDRLTIAGGPPLCGRRDAHRVNLNLTDRIDLHFVTDSHGSGRGFRIDVEQIHCGNTLREYRQVDDCCRREYDTSYAVLTSPGFLGGDWIDSDCIYTIRRVSPNVCRLRFRFRHFWVGDDDVYYGCVNGFLELDRRRFCGCLDGHEHVTQFDESGRKTLRYRSRSRGDRGFVIEVWQEECDGGNGTDPNTEVEVFETERSVSRYLIPRDVSRCARWHQADWTNDVRSFLSRASVPTECDVATASQNYPPDGDYDYPFDFGAGPPAFPFPPTLPPTPVYPQPPLFPGLPVFPPNICIILNGQTGRFSSPGYPGYPPNLRLCYAFVPLPGMCTIDIRFPVFDLEKSWKCRKDYLLFKSTRYCGRYLDRRTIRGDVDLRYPQAVITFVTDGSFAGRGFLAEYRQIPCYPGYPLRRLHDEGTNSTRKR